MYQISFLDLLCCGGIDAIVEYVVTLCVWRGVRFDPEYVVVSCDCLAIELSGDSSRYPLCVVECQVVKK